MKRRVIQLVLLLLAGAVINVSVAWALACFVQVDLWPSPGSTVTQPRFAIISTDYGRWEAMLAVRRGATVVSSTRVKYDRLQRLPSAGDPNSLIPPWTGFREQSARFGDYPNATSERRIADARGFPMVSLWSERTRVIDGMNNALPQFPATLQHGLDVAKWSPNTGKQWHTLPMKPLWPGFAFNTIFYAAMLWVVFFVPGIVKRRVRRRRGLCPACAYPVGTSDVCTECGAKLPLPREGEGRCDRS